MKPATGSLTVDVPQFSEAVRKWAAVSSVEIGDAFKKWGRSVAKGLMDATPPRRGKSIPAPPASLAAVGAGDPQAEMATARQVGVNAVRRDMTKLFFPVRNLDKAKIGKTFTWLFDANGLHYGVPNQFYFAGMTDPIEEIRRRYRTKNGKIQYNVKSAKLGTSWVNIMKYPIHPSAYKAALAKLERRVGRAKSGWAPSYRVLGGTVSSGGWIGRHAGTGSARADLKPFNAEILMVNQSEWARGGDTRTIASVLRGRYKAVQVAIEKALEKNFK